MMPAVDRTGDVVGRLTVLSRAPSANGRAQWNCVCSCGATAVVASKYLHSGAKSSCGCKKTDVTHGAARSGRKTAEYLVWVSMHQRCANPKNKKYADYGGRGIQVCPRWADFAAFSSDMGPRPSARHSVERSDNSLGYSPQNCRWATATEQASNTRRNVLVVVGGERLTVKQAVARFGGRYGTVLRRIHSGMTPEAALGLSSVSGDA